jgi:hypothetical protein
MVAAKNAHIIDTTAINADELLSIATNIIEGNLTKKLKKMGFFSLILTYNPLKIF